MNLQWVSVIYKGVRMFIIQSGNYSQKRGRNILKVRQNRNDFFKPTFNFTTMRHVFVCFLEETEDTFLN